MAMTEEQEAKTLAELAETKKQLTELLAKSQTEANEAKDKEAKRSKEKAGKVELDPDVVKELAELKGKVAKLEEKLGGSKSSYSALNFFGEK